MGGEGGINNALEAEQFVVAAVIGSVRLQLHRDFLADDFGSHRLEALSHDSRLSRLQALHCPVP